MYIIGFLRSIIPMMVCLVGLWLFTVRRDHCQGQYILCMAVVMALELPTYYFMFAEPPGIPISKILTTLLISLMIFWGGLYVYGGWARIGIYVFVSDMILAIGERIYLAGWEYFSHKAADASFIYYKENTATEPGCFPMYLVDCLIWIPFLIAGYKLRRRQLRPEWVFKTGVIVYLILGSSPLISRPGFEGKWGARSIFLVELVWVVLTFLILMTIRVNAVRENRRILYLRKQVEAEQSRLLMIQKEKARRLRHDIKKHLGNLDYMLQKDPGLCSDPSLQHYRERLKANEAWMQGAFYCDSSVMNLCFEQIQRFCDDRRIALEIVLKRLSFSGWSQEEQLLFGTQLFNLLQLYRRGVAAVRFAGDCLTGQNILRVTMVNATAGERGQEGDRSREDDLRWKDGGYQRASRNREAGRPCLDADRSQEDGRSQEGDRSRDKRKDEMKNRKLLSALEKDIRLILSKHGGMVECTDDGDQLVYVLNWRVEGNEVIAGEWIGSDQGRLNQKRSAEVESEAVSGG